MARNSRQAKVLELISQKEIETQEDLVAELKNAGYEVTQATISRDIKELALIKIATENGKYNYATISTGSATASTKVSGLFKQCVVSIKKAMNLVVVKTLKGTAQMAATYLDQMSISEVLGITFGTDAVMLVTADIEDAYVVQNKLLELIK